MKVITVEDLCCREQEESDKKTYDPKNLEDGLSSKEPMGEYGYGKPETVDQVK